MKDDPSLGLELAWRDKLGLELGGLLEDIDEVTEDRWERGGREEEERCECEWECESEVV